MEVQFGSHSFHNKTTEANSGLWLAGKELKRPVPMRGWLNRMLPESVSSFNGFAFRRSSCVTFRSLLTDPFPTQLTPDVGILTA